MSTKNAGYSLLELLLALSIFSILAAMTIAAMGDTRTRALYTTAQADMAQIRDAIVYGQGQTGLTLREITGSNCTFCDCLSDGMSSVACVNSVDHAIDTIQLSSRGAFSDLSGVLLDPWGNPYIIDENQDDPAHLGTVTGAPPGCEVQDLVGTAGQDGVINTPDDFYMAVPFIDC